MRRLSLLLVLVLPGLVHAQHPADLLRARLGDTISPEEQAYFGLFFPLSDRFRDATYTEAAGGLRLNLTLADTTGRAMDSTVVVDAETAELLARYVDEYETLFAGDGLVPRRRAYATLLRMQIARPARVYETGADVRIVRRDESAVGGTLLWADTRSLGVLATRGPFDWRAPDEVIVIAPSEVARVEVPGWPDAVVVGTTGLFVLLAQATVPLYDDAGTQGLDVLRAAATATGVVVLRERPRNRLLVEGQRRAYDRALPRLVGLSRYPALRPPELAIPVLPANPPAFAPETVPSSSRRYISVLLAHEFEASVGNAFAVDARHEPVDPGLVGSKTRTRVRPHVHSAGLHGELAIHALPWLSVSVEAARHRGVTLEPGTEEALGEVTLYGGSVRVRRRVQQTPLGDAWLSAGLGMRHVEASLQGVYLITAAAPADARAPKVYDTYAAAGGRWQPVVHVGYDVFFARHASLYVGVNAAMPLALRVDERTATAETATMHYEATLPAHTTNVAMLRYRFGVRLHL